MPLNHPEMRKMIPKNKVWYITFPLSFIYRQGSEAQGGNIVSENGNRKGGGMVSLFPWNAPYRKPLSPCRGWRTVDRNARQGETVGVCWGTLFGGTRTEIHDRKGRVSSRERPHGRDEIGSCHWPKAHCRVVQGTVREVKAEHTPTYTTAKEK